MNKIYNERSKNIYIWYYTHKMDNITSTFGWWTPKCTVILVCCAKWIVVEQSTKIVFNLCLCVEFINTPISTSIELTIWKYNNNNKKQDIVHRCVLFCYCLLFAISMLLLFIVYYYTRIYMDVFFSDMYIYLSFIPYHKRTIPKMYI